MSVRYYAVAAVLVSLTSCAGSTAQMPQTATARAAAEIALRVPAVQIAVWKSSRVEEEISRGWADIASEVRADAKTRFPVFSASKAWTATAAASLAEEGRLNPLASVAELVPEFSAKAWPITPMQLATHRSGVRHYRDDAEARVPRRCATVAEALTLFADDPLEFEPGTKEGYSSWGYVLLSRVVEVAAQMSFPAAMRERVLGPAGMESTVHAAAAAPSPTIAVSYRPANGRHAEVRLDPSCKWGAGGYYSTAGDLVRFYGALLGGSLVSDRFRMMILNADDAGLFRFGGSGEGGMSLVMGDMASGTVVGIVVNERREDLDLATFARDILEAVQ